MDKNPRRTILICLLLGAVTLATYWPLTQHEFVTYDDPDYVTDNAHVLTGWTAANLGWAFGAAHAGNWHPVTWLSHILDAQLFGAAAGRHHLVSLVFHTANAVLAFLLLQGLTGSTFRSAMVAALFAIHPLHVESVAWVAERKDVLSGFFFLLTLLAYVRYARPSLLTKHQARLSYVAALVFFALGLMSKPMLVTLPFVLLLLDYWPLKRMQNQQPPHTTVGSQEPSTSNFQPSTFARLLLEKIPFLALSVASSVVTFVVQQRAGAVTTLENLPLEFRISNALISFTRYAAKMVWPSRLAVFYPAPKEWPLAWVAAAALALAAVTALTVSKRRQKPHLAVGWFWYMGMLAPVIGIVQVGQQAMADRYTYLPLIGLFIMLVWSLPERFPVSKAWLAAPTAMVIGICIWLTRTQLGFWRNNTTLFAHALEVTHDNAVAQNNLGAGLLSAGKIAEAEPHFAEAVRIKPRYTDAMVNLGLCREKLGHDPEAIDFLERALEIRPSAAAHYNLANLLARQNNLEQAEVHYVAALELKPEFVQAKYNLGTLKAKQGKTDEAALQYQAVLRLKPNFAEAQLTYGALLAGQQKFAEAIPHFRAALQSAPNYADAHFNLAAALSAQGDPAQAATHYAAACRLRPDDLEARENLGLALLSQGKAGEALPAFEEVLRRRPDARAHHAVAMSFDGLGEADKALAHYREAVRLEPKGAVYLNDLAWLLATTPRAELRNGTEAAQLAEQACRVAGGNQARFWGTLDAAYAEAGRFEEAIATNRKAREMALATRQQMVVEAADERLKLYRERKPYRTAPEGKAQEKAQ